MPRKYRKTKLSNCHCPDSDPLKAARPKAKAALLQEGCSESSIGGNPKVPKTIFFLHQKNVVFGIWLNESLIEAPPEVTSPISTAKVDGRGSSGQIGLLSVKLMK